VVFITWVLQNSDITFLNVAGPHESRHCFHQPLPVFMNMILGFVQALFVLLGKRNSQRDVGSALSWMKLSVKTTDPWPEKGLF